MDTPMKDDRIQIPIDPPSARPTTEELKELAIRDADWKRKEEPFAWENKQCHG